MRRSWMLIVPAVVVWLLAFVMVGRADVGAAQGRGGGWNIPPTARTETSPLKVDDTVIANGKKLFSSKCQRCHGASGKGDGPDGDPAHADDMNLTNPARGHEQPGRRRLLQNLERPLVAQDADLLRGDLQGAGVDDRGVRADAPRQVTRCSDPCPIRFRNSASASSRAS